MALKKGAPLSASYRFLPCGHSGTKRRPRTGVLAATSQGSRLAAQGHPVPQLTYVRTLTGDL